jgi:hypothetical protein
MNAKKLKMPWMRVILLTVGLLGAAGAGGCVVRVDPPHPHPHYEQVWVPGHWRHGYYGDEWVPGHWE